jgi:hypothetical protein
MVLLRCPAQSLLYSTAAGLCHPRAASITASPLSVACDPANPAFFSRDGSQSMIGVAGAGIAGGVQASQSATPSTAFDGTPPQRHVNATPSPRPRHGANPRYNFVGRSPTCLGLSEQPISLLVRDLNTRLASLHFTDDTRWPVPTRRCRCDGFDQLALPFAGENWPADEGHRSRTVPLCHRAPGCSARWSGSSSTCCMRKRPRETAP